MTTETPAASAAPTPPTAADVEEAMRDVIDPELGINVVDLGLVYGIQVDQNNHAVIDMTLTSAACPLTDVIEDQTAQSLDGLIDGFRVNWVWMPPWGPEKITQDGKDQLRALGFNVGRSPDPRDGRRKGPSFLPERRPLSACSSARATGCPGDRGRARPPRPVAASSPAGASARPHFECLWSVPG